MIVAELVVSNSGSLRTARLILQAETPEELKKLQGLYENVGSSPNGIIILRNPIIPFDENQRSFLITTE